MRNRRIEIALIVLAIAVRIAAVLVLRSHEVPRSTYEHGEIAANILAGRGFSVHFLGADGPTSQQAPIYPYLVAAAYAVGGVEAPRALLILELAQAVLGGVLVAGTLALVAEVVPGRRLVALAAGLIVVVHPTLVYATTHVQVAMLAATLLVWAITLAYRAGRTGRKTDAILCGATLALLVLTDPILGLAAPGIAWAIRLGRTSWRESVSLVIITGVTALFGVTPWLIRNALVHGEFVFIKSSFGYAFWQGNCKLSEGTDKVVRPSVEAKLEQRIVGLRVREKKGTGTSQRAAFASETGRGSEPVPLFSRTLSDFNRRLWEARHEAGYIDDIALTREDYRELGSLTEPERSRRLFARAIADLRAEPMRYPRLCLRRLRYFVLFDETNPKTRSLIYRVGHVGLTFLAVLGLIAMPGTIRRRLGPTFLTVFLIALFHTLTIVSARFHIPIEPLLAVWAGCGLGRLVESPSRGQEWPILW